MTKRTRTFYVEMEWPCPSCRHANRGHAMVCARCGAPKTSSAADRMPVAGAAREVTDPTLLREATAGPNWKCPWCGCEERNGRGECDRCGGEREARASSARPTPAPSTPVPRPSDAVPSSVVRAVTPPSHARPSARTWLTTAARIAVGLAAIFGVVTGLDYCFSPTDRRADVVDLGWRTTADLEHRQVNLGEGWRDEMPVEAYGVACERRQHGTHDCHPRDCRCHSVPHSETYDCNCHEVCRTSCSSGSNGYARCTESCSDVCSTCTRDLPSTTECDTCYDQCPTYDDWCRYAYDTWPVVAHAELAGSDPTPQPPALRAASGPDERVVESLSLRVAFADRDGRYAYTPADVADYDRFRRTQRWHIRTNRAGMVWVIAREDRRD